MGEVLVRFQLPVLAPDGRAYEARACGSEMGSGSWHAWLEFVPMDGGGPVRSPRETTQPNRADTEYWATGLTPVYLEGALQRALAPRPPVRPESAEPSIFEGPDALPRPPAQPGVADAVLDPFAVYERSEALLRRQLGALSSWHLVNILIAYDLTTQSEAALSALPPAVLIECIVAAVKAEITARHSPPR